MRHGWLLAVMLVTATGCAHGGGTEKPWREVPSARAGAPLTPGWVHGNDGAVRHLTTGLVFPARAEHMTRGRLVTFDDEGLDVSAAYNHVSRNIWATVYVYPRKDPDPQLRGEVESVFRSLKRNQPEAVVHTLGSTRFQLGGREVVAHGGFATVTIDGEDYGTFRWIVPLNATSQLKVALSYDRTRGEEAMVEAIEEARALFAAVRFGPAGGEASSE